MTPPPATALPARAWLAHAGAVWLVVVLLQLAINAAAIAQWRFPDPDDSLRLVEVRNLLGGQGWFDLVQHRIDPLGGGVAMHWSRLVDIPIAAIILALRPLLGTSGAERAALVIVPLLTLTLAMLLVARLAARRVAGAAPERVVLACLVLAMAVPVMAQLRPMRIDHHGWQIVTALAGLSGLMADNRRVGGWVAGLAMACGLAISIEGLPLAVGFAGIGAWRWLRGGADGGPSWLTRYLAGLALASSGLFLATRGLSDLAEHCDAVAPVHLAVFIFAALAVALLAARRGLSSGWVLAGLALVGAGCGALIMALAPRCLGGGFVDVDPVVRHLWLDQVAEGLPIWRQDLRSTLEIAVPGLAGLAMALRLAAGASADQRRWWLDYALALGAALAVACVVARAGGASCAFAALPLSVGLGQWLAVSRRARLAERLGILMGCAVLVVPSLPVSAFALLAPMMEGAHPAGAGDSHRADVTDAASPSRVADCDIRDDAPMLSGLSPEHLLAPLDIGPELLLASPRVTVLATGHHRGAPAMRMVIDAFTADDARAHAIVHQQQIDTIAVCPSLGEMALYRHLAPGGLAARLIAGAPPRWLRPTGAGGKLQLWRVVN